MEYFDVKSKGQTKGSGSSASEKAPDGIETILVPTDFSEESLKALSYARALLTYFPGSVHLVYVHDIDFAYAVPALMNSSALIATEEVERRYRKDLEKLAKQFDLPGSTPEQHVRTGRAYREISELASNVGAQLIVIATHGRTGLRRLMLAVPRSALFATRRVRFSWCARGNDSFSTWVKGRVAARQPCTFPKSSSHSIFLTAPGRDFSTPFLCQALRRQPHLASRNPSPTVHSSGGSRGP